MIERRSIGKTKIPTVLLCLDRLARAGTQKHVLGLAGALAREGRWRPVVVGILEGGALEEELRAAGVEYRIIGAARRAAPGRWLGAAYRLARLANAEGASLIHGHLLYANTIAALAGLFAGLPSVAGERNAVAWKEPGARLRRWLVARTCRLVVANSRASARRAVRDGGFPESRTRIVPNGVDLREVRKETRVDTAVLRRPLIGAVANLTRIKGVDLLIEAAPRIIEAFPSSHFVVVGEGEEREALWARIQELGLERRVALAGSRPDAAHLASRFDVAVLPSRSEGLPNVLLEHLAARRPVVAARVGGIPEVVSDGREALLVEPEDPEAIARAVIRLLADKALAESLARAGRALVMARYDLEAVARDYADVLDSVIGRAPLRRPTTRSAEGPRNRNVSGRAA